MRAIWKGAVSFGLVNVPVRLFTATETHDVRFHQVHRADGGRIKMKRVCQACGEEVPWDQLAKGYEAPDGRTVMLEDDDFAGLPISTGREIDVLEFVPAEQVDPLLYDSSYYLEPEARTVKPYVLLREALSRTDRVAVVKVAIRQRETLAVLRVRDDVIVMQTLTWPDEIRAADFDVLGTDVELRDAEVTMAMSLVESLSGDFEPEQYEDAYATAVHELVEAKLEGVALPEASTEEVPSAEVVDLLTALQRSVERAKAARDEGDSGSGAAPAAATTPAPKKAATKTAAKKSAAKAAPATSAAKKSAAKKTAKSA